jgi:hypothetical protein
MMVFDKPARRAMSALPTAEFMRVLRLHKDDVAPLVDAAPDDGIKVPIV